jgi:hypothetical protein
MHELLFFFVSLDSFICSFQLIKEERRGKSIELLESSSEDDEGEDAENAGEESDEHGSDNSSNNSYVEESSEHEESSPNVDIIGKGCRKTFPLGRFV